MPTCRFPLSVFARWCCLGTVGCLVNHVLRSRFLHTWQWLECNASDKAQRCEYPHAGSRWSKCAETCADTWSTVRHHSVPFGGGRLGGGVVHGLKCVIRSDRRFTMRSRRCCSSWVMRSISNALQLLYSLDSTGFAGFQTIRCHERSALDEL